jgi:hypothetical protein
MYLRENGTPYYIGKGHGKRAYESYLGHLAPKDRSRILIFPMLNEAEAFESEIALIDLFGRKDLGTGCLRNRTDGGEGQKGRKRSEIICHKISEALKGNKCCLGRKYSKETCQKLSESNKGKHETISAAARKKMSDASREWWALQKAA